MHGGGATGTSGSCGGGGGDHLHHHTCLHNPRMARGGSMTRRANSFKCSSIVEIELQISSPRSPRSDGIGSPPAESAEASSAYAVEQSRAHLCKHRSKKSLASGDSQGGTSGTESMYPIRRTAARTFSVSLHGAWPVVISMTVLPSAHTSAAGPCSSPCATSGAMNAGVPPNTCFESTRSGSGWFALPSDNKDADLQGLSVSFSSKEME